MTNTAANILAGKPLATGGVLMGPTTATAPSDANSTLTGFTSAGYIGEDGLVETVDRSTEKVKAWGGDTVKVLQTDFSVTYQFTFLETLNSDVLKAVYGDANVTTSDTLHTVKVNGDTLPHKSFVFEVKDGDARIRIYVPDGQITEVGEVTYSDSDVIGYQVTVEAFRSSSLDANAVKYVDSGSSTAADPEDTGD